MLRGEIYRLWKAKECIYWIQSIFKYNPTKKDGHLIILDWAATSLPRTIGMGTAWTRYRIMNSFLRLAG